MVSKLQDPELVSNLAFKVIKKLIRLKLSFLKRFYRFMQKLNAQNKGHTLKWMEDYMI
jgi:hypothetical protein